MNNDNFISKCCSLVPVTFVKIFNKIILSGEGSFLHIYKIDKEKSECIFHYKIFSNSLIHGIKQNASNNLEMCIFGGRYFRIITFDDFWKLVNISEEKLTPHWILDVYFRNETLNILQADNTILILDLKTLKITNQICCVERCTLFSGLIYYDNKSEEYVLMSGTFFNQVLISSFCSSSIKSSESLQFEVLHRLADHKGIITSVFYHELKMQILTSSDDRSIQLWQVTFNSNNQNNLSSSSWASATFQKIITLFGHTSRVWKAVITKNYLISAGEEACCIVWNYSGKIVRKIKAHIGKNIWSLDVNEEESELITGGGDGSIRIWHLKNKIKKIDQFMLNLDINMFKDNSIRQVFFLKFDLLLILSMNGQLFLHTLSNNKNVCIMDDAFFSSYCTMATSSDGSLIAIGNIKGVIKLILIHDCKVTHILEERICESKIFSIIFLCDNCQILFTGPDGILFLYKISVKTDGIFICKLNTFVLPKCKQRWVTCAHAVDSLLICGDRHGSIYTYNLEESRTNGQPTHRFENFHGNNGVTFIKAHDNQVFTCGRDGVVNIFDADSNLFTHIQSNFVHKGFDWLTNLVFINDEIYVLGFLSNKFVAYNFNYDELILEVECGGGHRAWDYAIQNSKNKMDFRFVCIKQKGLVLFQHEFSSSQIIVKNPFGGSHINSIQQMCVDNKYGTEKFDVLLTCGEDGLVNIIAFQEYFLGESLHVEIENLLSMKIAASSLRTLFYITNSCSSNKKEYQDGFLICGGGGNIFKILSLKWKKKIYFENDSIPNDDYNTNPNLIIDKNRDNVSSAKFVDSLSIIHDTVSEVKHSLIFNSKDNITVKPQLFLLLTYDMNEKLFKKKKPWKKKEDSAAEEEELPEARCMDIDVFTCRENCIAIVVATSMAIIKVFIFNPSDNSCVPIWQSSFHNHCVTKVKHLVHHRNKSSNNLISVSENQQFICSTATDGKFAIWDLTVVVENYFQQRLYLNIANETDIGNKSDLTANRMRKKKKVPTATLR